MTSANDNTLDELINNLDDCIETYWGTMSGHFGDQRLKRDEAKQLIQQYVDAQLKKQADDAAFEAYKDSMSRALGIKKEQAND